MPRAQRTAEQQELAEEATQVEAQLNTVPIDSTDTAPHAASLPANETFMAELNHNMAQLQALHRLASSTGAMTTGQPVTLIVQHIQNTINNGDTTNYNGAESVQNQQSFKDLRNTVQEQGQKLDMIEDRLQNLEKTVIKKKSAHKLVEEVNEGVPAEWIGPDMDENDDELAQKVDEEDSPIESTVAQRVKRRRTKFTN